MKTNYYISLHEKALAVLEMIQRCERNINDCKEDERRFWGIGLDFNARIDKYEAIKARLSVSHANITRKIFAAIIAEDVRESIENKPNLQIA